MSIENETTVSDSSFGNRVRSAVFWRSGTQIISQMVTWGSTLAVIRLLNPADYGIFAMTQVVMIFLTFMSGYGFASFLVQAKKIDKFRIRQTFGLLILLNAGIATLQLILASAVSDYYRQPIIQDMLHLQALIFLASPFIILGEALLARELEFRKTAIANLLSAIVSASVALYCALQGYGVWTLVLAPLSGLWVRAIAIFFFAQLYFWPTFNFKGIKENLTFGLALLGTHMFWTIQSQSDIFIAGRVLDPHDLGIYAEALFFTTILAAKFIPPLNEIAFPAYAKLQSDPASMRYAFLKAVRLIMLVACPAYLGMSVTAGPLVATVLGPKWLEMAPFVAMLALAMPIMTLQIIFAPAINALGRPQTSLRISMFGAFTMPIIFLIAVNWGTTGLVIGWLVAFPILTGFTFWMCHDKIGITLRELIGAVAPGLSSSVAMAVGVYIVSRIIPGFENWQVYFQLGIMVACGGIFYAGLLWFLSPATFKEVYSLLVRRKVESDPAPEPSPES
ncbi:lipopolysaccharide biosynthesis protein [Parasphingorhabdus sp.]|uniref:lipopolysaccharide biosynthesis protein n=1 Tax=Parasphingorhabdus sp. TaxID=2709688 RepID=UPI003262E3A3